jgi:hypothetical protein
MIKQLTMPTMYAIQFKESEQLRVQKLLDYVQSLDFVQSVNAFSENEDVVEIRMNTPVEGYLTVDEIKSLYPNQWVLIANTRKNGTQILGGRLLLHEADKRDLALKGRDLIHQNTDVNHFYTGEFPSRPRIGLLRKISSPLVKEI